MPVYTEVSDNIFSCYFNEHLLWTSLIRFSCWRRHTESLMPISYQFQFCRWFRHILAYAVDFVTVVIWWCRHREDCIFFIYSQVECDVDFISYSCWWFGLGIFYWILQSGYGVYFIIVMLLVSSHCNAVTVFMLLPRHSKATLLLCYS